MLADQRIGDDVVLASTPRSVPSPLRQWYFVGVLGLVNALSFTDRNGLNLIVNPIRADLGISDTQMSVLIGLSFGILFGLLSLPAGYLVDLFNRRRLLTGAIIFWSCMAVISGFATNYWELFAARTGLGLGEAMLPSAAYSLIRDGVAPKNWGRAYALYNTLGGSISNLGMLGGGVMYGLATAGDLTTIPILDMLKPWQVVLVMPGLFGVVIAGLLCTLREPARVRPSRASVASFGEVFAYIGRHWRIYLPIFGGFFAMCIADYGLRAWLAASLGRNWDISPAIIGKTAGSIALVASPLPAFFYGYVMDRLKTRGHLSAPFLVAAVGVALNATAVAAMMLAPSLHAAWILYGVVLLFSASCVGTVCAIMLAEVTPDHLMGKMTSLYFLNAYVLGSATGPTIFAVVSEYFFSGPRAIAHSVAICYPASVGLAIVMMFIGAHEIRRWHRARTAGG